MINKVKRNLELASAIVSICVSSFVTLIMLVSLGNLDLYEAAPYYYDADQIAVIKTSMIIILLLNVVILALAIVLCTSPVKKGVPKSRLGVAIPLLVVIAIMAVLEISEILLFIAYATPFGMLIASVCMKHNVGYSLPNLNYTGIDSILQSGSTSENNEVKQVEENPDVARVLDNNSIDNIEEKLLKLKELKDAGVIDEEQYKENVDKILKRL